ncbi:MAG: aldehyde dehydrogenase family protein [Cellulosilyticaceae bacterium]
MIYIKDLTEQIQLMHRFFNTRRTYNEDFRLYFLKKLQKSILNHEHSIVRALHSDLNKPPFETYTSEISIVLSEITYAIKNLKKWMKPKRNISMFPFLSTTSITPEPHGVIAIIAPYNYPFQLALVPLIGAIAAGNCAVIKPSSHTPGTNAVLQSIINEVFPKHFVYLTDSTDTTSSLLLKQPLDYIFFTGSVSSGKAIMAEAAKTLTPVTLELGGKNPCVVDYNADLAVAAKRIAWGKFLNSGQTCVAPDYLLVHEDVVEPFLKLLTSEIKKMFSDKKNLSRMIHEEHYVKVLQCIDEDSIYYGGHFDTSSLYIEPTILYPTSLKSECMKEEIFGPVLPVLSFNKLETVIRTVKRFPKPLAMYVFGEDKQRINHLFKHLSFGGGAVNDTIIHLNNMQLPFGGVGHSGLGCYHGKYSFKTFSHYKPIVRSCKKQLPLRFPPYHNKIDFIKKYIRFK